MMVQRNSAKWTELFGHLDEHWVSERPSHQVFIDGIVDPSIWPSSIPSATDSEMESGLGGQGVRDVHSLTQHIMRNLVTQFENTVSTGLASGLENALSNIMTPQSIGGSVALNSVKGVLTDTSGAGAGKKVASALFATGMSALSCTGPIGAAAAAIIGFATFIAKLFISRKQWQIEQQKELVKRAYQSMPPLQVAGNESDNFQVGRVFDTLQKGNWTHLFAPRFNPRSEWVGAPRNGGFGFAPGKRFNTKDEFGIDTAKFEPTGGVGFNPATGRITSVVQISLDPIGDDVNKWFDKGKVFPVKKAHVRDVGDFYASTANACSIAWSLVTQEQNSPHLYKVDVGTPEGDRDACLHNQWRSYFAGAINFIKINGSEWTHWESFGLSVHGRTMNRETPEFLLGTGLSCVAGSWACYKALEWSLSNPVLDRADPGYPPHQMRADMGLKSGCVIQPSQALVTSTDGRLCLVTLYDSQLKRIFTKVRERQESLLYTTVVCAYVRSDWDAFRDPALLERLNFARSKLLTNERALASVRLVDVSKTETYNGENWYQQLKTAGAGRLTKLAMRPGGAGAVEPPSGPPPAVPQNFSPPFSIDEPTGRNWTKIVQTLALLGGASAAVGFGYEFLRGRRQ